MPLGAAISEGAAVIITDGMGRKCKRIIDTDAPGKCCCIGPGPPCYRVALHCFGAGSISPPTMTCAESLLLATPFFLWKGQCFRFDYSDPTFSSPPSIVILHTDVSSSESCDSCQAGLCYRLAKGCPGTTISPPTMTCDDAAAAPFFLWDGQCFFFDFSDPISTTPLSTLIAAGDVVVKASCDACTPCAPCQPICAAAYQLSAVCSVVSVAWNFTPYVPPCDALQAAIPPSGEVDNIPFFASGAGPSFTFRTTITNPLDPTDTLQIDVVISADCSSIIQITSANTGDQATYTGSDITMSKTGTGATGSAEGIPFFNTAGFSCPADVTLTVTNTGGCN